MGLISKKYFSAISICLLAAACLAYGRFDADCSTAAEDNLPNFVCLQSDNFQVYFENKVSANANTLEMLESVYDRFIELMTSEGYKLRSSDQFKWFCFDDRNSYQNYSLKADGFVADKLISYYSARTNYVAILSDKSNGSEDIYNDTVKPHQISASDFSIDENRGARTSLAKAMMTHELIHQLSFNTGLQKRGVEYPLWVSEGIATSFEHLFDSSPNWNNPSRMQTVIRMQKDGNLIPLNFFVSMSRLSWPELTDSEIYAQCCSFFEFLWETRKTQLQNYLSCSCQRNEGPSNRASLKKEFIDSFGPIKKIERDWKHWLLQVQ